MKYKPDKNQITWGITAVVTSLIIMLLFSLLFNVSGIWQGVTRVLRALNPVIYGVAVTLILSPIVNKFEALWFKKKSMDGLTAEQARKRRKTLRFVSVFIAEAVLIAVLTVIIVLILPQLIESVQHITTSLPSYINNATRSVNHFIEQYAKDFLDSPDEAEATVADFAKQISNFVQTRIVPNITSYLAKASGSFLSVLKAIFNFLIGIIVSAYLLFSKETMSAQWKKLIYGVCSRRTANMIIEEGQFINRTFIGFISGKILDSLIMAFLCLIGTWILKTPYYVLVSIIVGVTNIIPFFGPYIGEVLGVIIVGLIDPLAALYFLIFVVLLQQFDGNILGPKILGNTTGLSSFWVIFAIMLFGGLFGVAGWILGVPLFAVIFAGARRIANYGLRKKGMPTESAPYHGLQRVDEDQNFIYIDDHKYEEEPEPEKAAPKSEAAKAAGPSEDAKEHGQPASTQPMSARALSEKAADQAPERSEAPAPAQQAMPQMPKPPQELTVHRRRRPRPEMPSRDEVSDVSMDTGELLLMLPEEEIFPEEDDKA